MRRAFTTSDAPEFPPRPYLPPAAAGAAGALVAAALGLEFGWRSYISSDSGVPGQIAFAVLAVSCAVGLPCIFARRFWGERMRRWARWLGIGIVLGAASATLGTMWRTSAHERMENIVSFFGAEYMDRDTGRCYGRCGIDRNGLCVGKI